MLGIKAVLFQVLILGCMLLGLPLLGVMAAGRPAAPYLQFPPPGGTLSHLPFSWAAFAGFGALILAAVSLLIIGPLRAAHRRRQAARTGSARAPRRFAWWGWLAVGTGSAAWVLAWTRFPWFSAFQPHTFSPLWLSYILVINALCRRRTGRCLMTDRPRFFLLLFPVSAGFWWFFEYLNRFVQNWHYTGLCFDARQYFWYATLCFATVLPAVLSTRQWLLSADGVQHGYADFVRCRCPWPRLLAAGVLGMSAVGLAAIGVWPNFLFPLVWISPLLIIVCLQSLMGQRHVFSALADGDWRGVASAALAALVCGFFWEMWNFYSLAKWQYQIPLVQGFKVFEMPLLGYGGYLPFGLECVAVAGILDSLLSGNGKNTAGDLYFCNPAGLQGSE